MKHTAPSADNSPGLLAMALGAPRVLYLLLGVGFLLRFYHLETPWLWWNEMLVALAGRFSLPYIFEWTFTCEIHPPYLYAFNKAVMALGTSEFTLRLVPALCGTTAIAVMYGVGRRIMDERVGLIVAALVAVNPLLLFVSRQLRPYSALFLLIPLAAHFLIRFAATNRDRDMYALVLTNMALYALSYISFLIALAQGAALLVMRLTRMTSLPYRRIAILFALFLASSVISMPFCLGRARGVMDAEKPLANPPMAVLATAGDNVAANLYFFDNMPVRAAMVLLALIGAVRLLRRDKTAFTVYFSLLAAPVAVLTASGYAYDFRSWNSVFMAPPLLLFAASGLAATTRTPVAAGVLSMVLALGFGANILLNHQGDYYRPESGIEGASSKGIAMAVADFVRPGELTLIDNSAFNNLSWYLDRDAYRNVLREQSLEPGQPLLLNVPKGQAGHLNAEPGGLRALFGEPLAVGAYPLTTLEKWRVERRSPEIGALPASLSLRARPEDFYRQVSRLRDVMIWPFFTFRAIATRNSEPALIEYELTNNAPDLPQQFDLRVKTFNKGRENRLAFRYAFDDEPWNEAFVSQGPDPLSERRVRFKRDAPYSRLNLAVEMRCEPITPSYPGGNLETLGFEGLEMSVRKAEGDLFKPETLDQDITTTGLDGVARDGDKTWIWGKGPESRIDFELPEARTVTLDMAFTNPIPGQEVVIEANGREIARYADLPARPWLSGGVAERLSFQGLAGRNALTIRYAAHNAMPGRPEATFAPGDPSPYAAAFTALRLNW